MTIRQVNAARFKAECLALLDDVAATGQPILVTKRGKPVARVVPVEEPRSLVGSVTFNVSDDELLAPIEREWHAQRA